MYFRLSPYQEVLQGVLTSLQVNEGIIKITGKSGAGKTALCSQLFDELRAAGQPAVFFLKPPASPVALQNDILDNLALDPSGNFTRTLTAYLLAKTTEHKPLVLIFDDAQQLDAQTFGAIRMLCNIQDNARALVRVILCGTHELDDKLASPALRAVTQFLSQSFTLPYLTQEQVNDFCQAYWMLMGEEMKPMDARVLQKLSQETRGHPGILQARLNQGTTGAQRNERPGEDDGAAAAAIVKPHRYAPRKNWVPALLIVAGLIVLGGAGAYLFLIPSLFEEAVYPPLPAAVAARAQESEPVVATAAVSAQETESVVAAAAASAQESEPVVAAAAVSAEPAAEIADTALAEPNAELADAGGAETQGTAVAGRAAESAPEVPDEVIAPAPAAEQGIDAAPVAEPQNPEAQVAAETSLPTVEEFLDAWTASWQNKDLDTYLAYYDASFVPPQNLSREAWQEQRRRVINNAVDIMVTAEAPESISEAPGGLRFVRFWLNYSAANYADRTLKELLLVPDNGTWRIRVESNLRTERQ